MRRLEALRLELDSRRRTVLELQGRGEWTIWACKAAPVGSVAPQLQPQHAQPPTVQTADETMPSHVPCWYIAMVVL